MVEIEKPRIECIDSQDDVSYGKYIVEPLERGYGTTLGNSLRRILLSSLPGTAATSIKIAGVQHEFSTVPGVKEDVTEIVLNVKKIIARAPRPSTLTLRASAKLPPATSRPTARLRSSTLSSTSARLAPTQASTWRSR